MVECEYCGKPLKKIGYDRSNGRLYAGNGGKDWDGRKYHKKCYKDVMLFNRFKDKYSNTSKTDE